MVRRIQTFAQDNPPAACCPTDLQRVVHEAVDATRPVWMKRDGLANRIDLRMVLGDVAPVSSRPTELREVLTNLILNAVDAMPDGGVITLTTLRQDAYGCIVVADTGIGMAEDVQRRIFDPFFTTKNGNGSGLGLSVSYMLIRGHGGDIEVESTPGDGACFLVKLPIAE